MHDDSGPGLEPDARDDSQLALEPDSEEAGQRDANSHTTGQRTSWTPEEMPDSEPRQRRGGNAAQDESELPDSADFREVANLADTAPGLTETAEASEPPKAARGRSEFPDWTDSTHAADSMDPAAPADSAPGGSEVSEAAEASRTPKAARGRNGSGGKALRGKSTKTKKTSGKKRGPKGKFNRELFEKVADRVRAGQKDTPAIQAEGMGRSAFLRPDGQGQGTQAATARGAPGP